MSALDLINSTAWAMEHNALESLKWIAERHDGGIQADIQLISKETGKPMEHDHRVTMKRGVAHIPLTGPIFPKANLMTAMSGATSVQSFVGSFDRSMRDPEVRAIIINADTPGGAVTGIDEAAEIVYRARASKDKPIYTHVSGMLCSAGYWIGSASGGIFATPNSIVGSIGVVHSASKENPKSSIAVRTSQNAPNKRLDPESDAGKAAIDEMINEIEANFLKDVARGRGVSTDYVIENYGQGGVLTARAALKAGMIDGVMTEDDLLDLVSMMS